MWSLVIGTAIDLCAIATHNSQTFTYNCMNRFNRNLSLDQIIYCQNEDFFCQMSGKNPAVNKRDDLGPCFIGARPCRLRLSWAVPKIVG